MEDLTMNDSIAAAASETTGTMRASKIAPEISQSSRRFPILNDLINQIGNNDNNIETMKHVDFTHECLNLEGVEAEENGHSTSLLEDCIDASIKNSEMNDCISISNNSECGSSMMDSNNDFYNLRSSDVKILHNCLDTVMNSLSCNTFVEKVRLDWDFLRYVRVESRMLFLHTIMSMPNVKSLTLNFGDQKLSLGVLSDLLRIGNIESFILNDAVLIEYEEGTDFACSNTGLLSSLSLSERKTRANSLKQIALDNITILLDLSLNDVLRTLSGLDTLEEICISNTFVEDEKVLEVTVRELCDMPELKKLTLDTLEIQTYNDVVISGIAKSLELGTTKLNYLKLSGGVVNDTSLLMIADSLKNNNTSKLEELHVTYNNLGTEALFAIQEIGRGSNSTIKCLGLDGNNMNGSTSNPGCASVSNLLLDTNFNSTLTELSLMHNKLGNCINIAKALSCTDTTLEKLNLSYNCLDQNSLVSISNAITRNSVLKVLRLDGNMQAQTCLDSIIANALKYNTTLREISLENNDMLSCTKIASVLSNGKNTTLQKLLLSFNQLNDDSGIAIAGAIRKNKSLKVIAIRNNPIGLQSCLHIANSLKSNSTLEEIYLDSILSTEEQLQHYDNLSFLEGSNYCNNNKSDITGSSIVDAITSTLEYSNYTVRVISLRDMGIHAGKFEKMKFYLTLNQIGRGNLVHNDSTTRKEWLQQIMILRQNLNQLYYWMRFKPSLLLSSLGMKASYSENKHLESCSQNQHLWIDAIVPNRKRLKKN